jgi:hypothetical protein
MTSVHPSALPALRSARNISFRLRKVSPMCEPVEPSYEEDMLDVERGVIRVGKGADEENRREVEEAL